MHHRKTVDMEYWIFGIALSLILLGAGLLTLVSLRRRRKSSVNYAKMSIEDLKLHAKRATLTYEVTFRKNFLNWPIPRVNDNYSYITSIYKELNETIRQKRTVPPAAEWLLDNYYILEEYTKNLKKNLLKKDYYNLPVLKEGPYKGYTRILAIAMEFVAIMDGQIDEGTLIKYLESYQDHSVLFDREIRIIPMMLQIALLEDVRLISEHIKETQKQWDAADIVIDKWWSGDQVESEKIINSFINTLESNVAGNNSFVEHLFYRLRKASKSYISVLSSINHYLLPFDTTIEAIAGKEHTVQAESAVSMGNVIVSFKYITSLNWTVIFESLSFIEKILRNDPFDIYRNMTPQSRGLYISRIEKIAKKHKVSERRIAQVAINMATTASELIDGSDPEDNAYKRRAHVGFYLIGEGVEALEKTQVQKVNPIDILLKTLKKYQGQLYFGMIYLTTGCLVWIAIQYAASYTEDLPLAFGLFITLVTLIPASEISVSLINWSVGKLKQPSFFPSLEFEAGIPQALSTMVVVPALLSDENRVTEILQSLENHYLANKEQNLYFAIIGGFKDSTCESQIEENPILIKAYEGIRLLNLRYADENGDLFYFFHRKNIFNDKEQNWTGWERKRGALMEFNDLILGALDTSFIEVLSSHFAHSRNIKYIITLDADTQLPLGMAKRMIGTMAHPHNLPVIDPIKNIVVEGHGLMQPRIAFDMESSNKSIFSRIYTGQVGMDPYASAISDVYQDLFDEGIFTGKGIYDLRIFRKILKGAIPENSILSHDLLEGSYVRAALVSDLELVDAYPTKYNAYMARLYRWIRGDWQLIPWLKRTVMNKSRDIIANPLSYISLWKITDNLRRSLVSPSLMLLIILALTILPGRALFWLGGVSLVILLPLLTSAMEFITRNGLSRRASKSHIPGYSEFKAALIQLLFTSVFLAYQSMMILRAIGVTLFRVFITKKKMLEWVTSDDAERMQSNDLKSYVKSMGLSALTGFLITGITLILKPENTYAALSIAIIWAFSPLIAYIISKGNDHYVEQLKEEELTELRQIARKTWRYFEEFSNKANHYLAPDNYQEDPYRGIAYRTSPTNIGLGLLASLTARDFGYSNLETLLTQLERTLKTIGELDKWHGHLYNWYDTKTLVPLKPCYISTVDSGNFVGYLMTLRQGLIAYLDRPLFDYTLIRGIDDTYACSIGENKAFFTDLNPQLLSEVDGAFSLVAWKQTIERAIDTFEYHEAKKEAWRYKLEHLIEENLKELLTFTPWVNKLENIPTGLNRETTRELSSQWLLLLDTSPLLGSYASHCTSIQMMGNALLEITLKENDLESVEVVTWIKEILQAATISQDTMALFMARYQKTVEEIHQLSENAQFKHLYEKKRELFSIGFNLENNRLTNSYYDLLASEARQISYIAIARGEIEPKHWGMLSRTLTIVDRYKGLISWSGTMFEYLMPLILMKNYKNTLLDETYSFVIKSQKKYGRERNMPWGVSESGFSTMDLHLDYQYKAIGVPWLGLKRGLIEDAVAAPYATFLALLVHPRDAFKNILYLKKEGLEGDYGYYEAADYTPERLHPDQDKIIVKSYMAHHQGMSLLSLNNYLNQNIMQKRFSADPYVRAARLLLQEKVPTNIVYTKESKEKILPFKGDFRHEESSFRRFTQPNFVLPKAHVLSNGDYSVVTTDKGTGYSRTKAFAITRWRDDAIIDSYGMFFYIKNKTTSALWSATYAPLNTIPEGYEVIFTADKTVINRVDGDIQTRTEIIVTSGENAEIRRVELKNTGENSCDFEITSFYEVVMAPQKSDEAHPAFSNLFVETEYHDQFKALLAHRRPRSEMESDLWIAHMAILDGQLIGDIEYETDRMQFIGRGRTVSNPFAISRERSLSNTVGNVLDPIFSLRLKINILPNHARRISFVTMVANSKERIIEMISKYSSLENCNAAFWLAVIRSQIETKYLNIKAHEMELYQEMISDILFLSPLRQKHAAIIAENRKNQSALWAHGISGDRPIVLVKIRNAQDSEMIYNLLKAHEYWHLKDLRVDLIILAMETYSYSNPVFGLINDIVESSQESQPRSRKDTIFVLNETMINAEDMNLLIALSRLFLYGPSISLIEQLQHLPLVTPEPLFLPSTTELIHSQSSRIQDNLDNLQFFNGTGGFSEDQKHYMIHLEHDQTTPVPWSNIIANETFGFLVTESGGGYTWCQNSHENKLTSWSNDTVCDTPSETFYLRDEGGAIWSMTPLPIREATPYQIEHGFGYTTFKHNSHGITQSLTQFVPRKGNLKVSLIQLKNESNSKRELTLTYYVEPVLGVSRTESALHLVSSISEEEVLAITNHYNPVFPNQILYMDTSVSKRRYSTNRKLFLGQGGRENPDELSRIQLANQIGAGFDHCGAMQIQITLAPNETLDFVFVMGIAASVEEVAISSRPYRNLSHVLSELQAVQAFWTEKLGVIQVSTPDVAMNQMMNGHLLYQVIACRLWARAAFYQAGGAFGFRDQLQDTLALLPVWPDITRSQLIKHAGHQFEEGDVLHWWHEPVIKGTRTRISDDFLWLPYSVACYLESTSDHLVLDEIIPYLQAELLTPLEHERYFAPQVSQLTGTLYDHCIRAINHGLRFGKNGLPLIGGGDWNDGMNKVGSEGKGESIWLAWFLLAILKQWIPICIARGDLESARHYEEVKIELVKAVEENGWDGNWYKRAYFDDGQQLGSTINSECKIDSLSQSWAVLSGSGNPERATQAMASLEDYLVNHHDGIIRLLTPPFDNGSLEPGYIKGYVPGVRENGGQYTHAATWVVAAFAKLGNGNKAFELFSMINPINHARTNLELGVYKAEPYVMAADVYGCRPHIGRGGWTWYTGAAGWMYQTGLHSILGFTKMGDHLLIDPCIPTKWQQFSIQYDFEQTQYMIQVRNPDALDKGIALVKINGIEQDHPRIPLFKNRGVVEVDVVLKPHLM